MHFFFPDEEKSIITKEDCMWLSNNRFPAIEGIDTSLSVCMKRPTGSWNSRGFAGYRPAGQPICLCLQMAGAAAIKGQQNVNRTRPYSGCNHEPVTRGGTHPGGVTQTLSLWFSPPQHTHNVYACCSVSRSWALMQLVASLSSTPQAKVPPISGDIRLHSPLWLSIIGAC